MPYRSSNAASAVSLPLLRLEILGEEGIAVQLDPAVDKGSESR